MILKKKKEKVSYEIIDIIHLTKNVIFNVQQKTKIKFLKGKVFLLIKIIPIQHENDEIFYIIKDEETGQVFQITGQLREEFFQNNIKLIPLTSFVINENPFFSIEEWIMKEMTDEYFIVFNIGRQKEIKLLNSFHQKFKNK